MNSAAVISENRQAGEKENPALQDRQKKPGDSDQKKGDAEYPVDDGPESRLVVPGHTKFQLCRFVHPDPSISSGRNAARYSSPR
jgi:hypothetical protein